MKNLTLLIAAFVLPVSASAWQIHTSDFASWTASLKVPASVFAQLNSYFQEKPAGDQSAYVASLPDLLRQKSFGEMQARLAAIDSSERCETFFNASFVSKLFKSSPVGAQEFEKEMIRAESVSCLGQKNTGSVFEALMSDEFQKKTIMGLAQIKSDPQTNQVCHSISTFGIGRSDYCFTQNVWQEGELFVIHSYNESNSKNATAIVYFREMLTVIKRLKNGEALVYNLTYGRGPDLPFHSVVLRMLKGQHSTFIEELKAYSR